MVDRIEGDSDFHLTPAQKAEMKRDYKELADGFQQQLKEYQTLETKGAKEVCFENMEECMHAMNGIAIDFRKDALLRQTGLEQDLEKLDPDTATDEDIKQVQADLDKAKKLI